MFLDTALDSRYNLVRCFDSPTIATERLCHICIVARNVCTPVFLGRYRHNRNLNCHRKLLNRTDKIGICSRTAVLKSIPVKPIAALPQTLIDNASGEVSYGWIGLPASITSGKWSPANFSPSLTVTKDFITWLPLAS